MGGASLYIEVQSVRHKSSGGGALTTTGQMGSVMEESTRIAHTFARRKLEEYQVGGLCGVCVWGVVDVGGCGSQAPSSFFLHPPTTKHNTNPHQPDNAFFDTHDLHMHVPEGAIPKEGPSAGITMTTALLSLALNRPVRADVAMTGEISLTGAWRSRGLFCVYKWERGVCV